jgi:hypothetical protein
MVADDATDDDEHNDNEPDVVEVTEFDLFLADLARKSSV